MNAAPSFRVLASPLNLSELASYFPEPRDAGNVASRGERLNTLFIPARARRACARSLRLPPSALDSVSSPSSS